MVIWYKRGVVTFSYLSSARYALGGRQWTHKELTLLVKRASRIPVRSVIIPCMR